jgi:hypothetical protein
MVPDTTQPPHASPSAPPWIFMVLIVPFGLVGGFLGVALAYELKQAGISAAAIAGLIALSYVPNTWKFLWAPLVDLSWTRALVPGLHPGDRPGHGGHGLVLARCAALGRADGGDADHQRHQHRLRHVGGQPDGPQHRRRGEGPAAGWFQAGNLGGGRWAVAWPCGWCRTGRSRCWPRAG